ncbi:hypothetical protein AAFF_G00060520 [Aldrovandia affinis]|uniref:Uncharacterized protein n=1 Tax=Aldrovandia affinis TaxID=143900 RepID=A0AAD7S051_9TELE|nr:hypothetical protein AAFF_G00060520 [Aldrovandia affinis]
MIRTDNLLLANVQSSNPCSPFQRAGGDPGSVSRETKTEVREKGRHLSGERRPLAGLARGALAPSRLRLIHRRLLVPLAYFPLPLTHSARCAHAASRSLVPERFS